MPCDPNLGELEQHLNGDLSPENQLNRCQFVEVECTHKCVQYCHINTHETHQCKKRPYSCDHCRDYDSTFEDVTEVHYPQCGRYPVSCPNDCDVSKIERQDLDSHLKDQCPLAQVHCPFHYAGCETHLPRKDMPEHMRENVTHLTSLATFTEKLSVENKKLVKEIQQLQQKATEERRRYQEVKRKQQITEDEVQALAKKQKLDMHVLVSHPGFPVDFRVSGMCIFQHFIHIHKAIECVLMCIQMDTEMQGEIMCQFTHALCKDHLISI